MCNPVRAIEAVGTGGLSETVRAGMSVANGGNLLTGLTNAATFGAATPIMGSMQPKIPNVPQLPTQDPNVLPGAPPPPAPTTGSSGAAMASPFQLSIRPRRSQSLRTDNSGNGAGGSGLNIPT